MCGRYTLTTRRSDEIQAKLADTLGVETPSSDCGFERFNIAPTQKVLAVVDDRDGRRIEELRWASSRTGQGSSRRASRWSTRGPRRSTRGPPTAGSWRGRTVAA